MIRSYRVVVCVVLLAGCYYRQDASGPPDDPGDLHPCRAVFPPPPSTPGYDAGRPPDARPDPSPPPTACPGPAVDRWKELLILDGSVVGDGRARNDDADGPWSFRRRLEDLAGSGEAAAALAQAWLGQARSLTSVSVSAGLPGAARVAVVPRPDVDRVLICPWLRLTPENGCNAGCSLCADRRLDLARAPFRLLAIANRADLAGAACGRDGGELRFVYTAVRPDTGAALPFTVIFEYQVMLPPGDDARRWAGAWRALGALPFGPAFNARLAEVTARGLGGATLARVHTNEAALGPLWEMRHFTPLPLDRGGVTHEASAVTNTPRASLDGTGELAVWIQQNRRPILDGDNLLRPDMLAGSAFIPSPDFAWRAPGADPQALAAFNRNSCNGCHGGRDATDLPFQHIAPADADSYPSSVPAPARVSRYLHDPGRDDELSRRGTLLQSTACAPCGAYYPPPGGR